MKNIVYLVIITSLIGAGVFSINLGKFQLSLFRGLIVLLSFLMLAELLLKGAKILVRTKKDNNFSIKFMSFWLFYALLTLGWVRDYTGWAKAIYFLGLGLLSIVLMCKFLKTKYDVVKVLYVFSYMIIVHNVIGWYEIISGEYMFLSDDKVSQYSFMNLPVSMFGNTNDFAVFLMFSIFILYICVINTKRIMFKLVYAGTAVSSIALLLYTGSRGGLLGLIIALMTFAFMSIRRKQTKKVLLVLFFIIAALVILNPDIINNLVSNLRTALNFNFQRQSGSDFVRKNLMINGIQFLFSTLGFGTGAGNIEHWMRNYGTLYTQGVTDMHNWWLEILVGYGIVIFVFYCIFYIKLLKDFKQKFRQAQNRVDLSISLGFVSIISGYIVASFSSSSNMRSEWLWIFWGITIAYQGIELKAETEFFGKRN